MSLANKYRPQTFDDMVEQSHIIPILKAHVSKIGQRAGEQGLATPCSVSTYLLYGPRGTGKTTSARLIAKGINCDHPINGNPCNQCTSCNAINEGTTMDVVEIDAASHTGVDNIREEILDKASYRPTILRKKVYIIDEVHMLSKGAFNALLKIMEEPEEYLCFILATTEIHKVPETIVSRCQVFNFKRISTAGIIEQLKSIAQKENLTAEDEGLALIAKIADGCDRDAIKYLDQISVLGAITADNVSKFLGIVSEATIREFIDLINLSSGAKQSEVEGSVEGQTTLSSFLSSSIPLSSVSSFLDNLQSSGVDISQFTRDVLGYCDEHFLDNPPFYAYLSDLCKRVLIDIKRYPNPVLAYKVQLTANS